MQLIDNINYILAATKPGTEQLRYTSLSKDEFNYLLKTDYSDMLDAQHQNNTIYRGINREFEDLYYYTYPKKRISANTSNIYTRLMSDFLPSWSEFPKRNESFICTTDYHTAHQYGYAYQIYPKNGTKIGVCPQNDIWWSFENFYDRYLIHDLDQFNWLTLHMLAFFYTYEDPKMKNIDAIQVIKNIEKKFVTNDNKLLKQFFNRIDKNIKKYINYFPDAKSIDSVPIPPYFESTSDEIKTYVRDFMNFGNSLAFFNKLFDPKEHGFEIVDTSYLVSNSNVLDRIAEVWFSAPCLIFK